MGRDNSKVSIIIPVYNGADYLKEAIDGALAQTWQNKEIIIVNDGSDDNGATSHIAHNYADSIRYFEKRNGGVASALNLGIQEMKGEYFSWLSHDDLYFPKKVSHQMHLIQKCGDPTQLVAGNYCLMDEHRSLLGVMDFYQLYGKKNLIRPLFPVFHCAVNGCTILIHKSHFDRVGLFDESRPTTQDYDMWFRMLRGRSLLYSRPVDVVSRVHAGQTSVAMKDAHQKECNDLWIGMLEQLTDREMIEMAGSKQNFYADLYDHFKRYTTYINAMQWLLVRKDYTHYTTRKISNSIIQKGKDVLRKKILHKRIERSVGMGE